MTLSISLFAFLISVSLAFGDYGCPPEEKIAPKCVCKSVLIGPVMLCNKIMSTDELTAVFDATANFNIHTLLIRDSSLLYIPDGIFKDVGIKVIHFDRTELMSLAETDVAFEGLENTLVMLSVLNGGFTAEWSWSQLRNLQELKMFNADRVSLSSISEPFPELKLTSLSLTSADISYIVPQAFEALKELQNLVLVDNDISELNRNMFPDPANKLSLINLSDNKLVSLPDNIFHNMPELSKVFLENNQFTTIKEETFSPIMGQIIVLSLYGNDLRCDCRIRWIVKARKPRDFNAVCSHPNSLKERAVEQLEAKDLWC